MQGQDILNMLKHKRGLIPFLFFLKTSLLDLSLPPLWNDLVTLQAQFTDVIWGFLLRRILISWNPGPFPGLLLCFLGAHPSVIS